MAISTGAALAAGAIGSSVLSSAQQSKAAGKAADAQVQASQQSIDAQKEALEQQLATTQPFRSAGQSAINPLLEALGLQQLPSAAVQPQQGFAQAQPGAVNPGIAQIDQQIADLTSQIQNFRTARNPRTGQIIKAPPELQSLQQNLAGLELEKQRIASQPQAQLPVQPGVADASQPSAFGAPGVLPTPGGLVPPTDVRRQTLDGEFLPGSGPRSIADLTLQDIPLESPIQPRTEFGFNIPEDTFQPVTLPGREILDNPLLKSIQEDVTERLFANRASRGILGAGGTADELFSSLAPTALNLGLDLQARGQAQRERQANLGLSLQAIEEAQRQQEQARISGQRQQDIGLALDLQGVRAAEGQQNVQNLFNLLGLGANVASGQGTAIQQTGAGVAGALQQAGAARAQGALGRGQAISQGIGDVVGLGILGSRGFFNPTIG